MDLKKFLSATLAFSFISICSFGQLSDVDLLVYHHPSGVASPAKQAEPLTYQAPAAYAFGEAAMLAALKEKLEYPALAIENGREGMVVLKAVIDRSGQLAEVAVLKGLGLGCDEAAIHAVNQLKNWTPAIQGTNAVPGALIIPVKFRLR